MSLNTIKNKFIIYLCSNMVRKIIIPIALLLICSIASAQQTYKSHIQEDTRRAGAVFAPYDMSYRTDSPAPRGYKPFYISHFGRHGSRFMSDGVKDLRFLSILQKADSLGILTDDGKEILKRTTIIVKEAEGRYAQLTPLGEREQKALAQRMSSRFPSIFKVKEGIVRAESSVAPRCILSMTAFTNALKGSAPQLDFSFAAGERYQQYIAPEGTVDIAQRLARKAADSLSKASMKGDKFFTKVFNDIETAASLASPETFANLAYGLGCEAICIGRDELDIFKFFDIDELEGYAIVRNNLSYAWSGRTLETGDIRARSAAPLLRRIVEKADEALSEGHVVADLCFGHDSNVLPLACLIGIDGADQDISFVDAHKTWRADEHLCMAANIQFVFYKNKKGHVLVKVLENERERRLHIGIEPVFGSYYDWEALRSAFLLKCA